MSDTFLNIKNEMIAATGAGIVTTIIGHPLDTIKVHLQTNPNLKSTRQATASLIKNRALFRGIIPPLINAIIMNSVMFSVFRGIKGEDDSSATASFLAASLSGFATACISTPTDLIKIQAQLNSMRHLPFSSMRSLYRGHMANLGREGIFTMVYLGLYDQIKPVGFWQIAAASSFTGGLAWIASYPFDTLKTIIQSSSPPSSNMNKHDHHKASLTYSDAIKRIHNISTAYRGCAASTGRAVLVTSLRMIVYEWIMQNLSFDT